MSTTSTDRRDRRMRDREPRHATAAHGRSDVELVDLDRLYAGE